MKKMKFKSVLFFILVFLITVMVVSCSNSATDDPVDPALPSGSTIVGNTTSYLVTFSAVTNGKSTVTIPLGVFGDSSDDLVEYSVDVTVNNGTAITVSSLQSYFSSSAQAVLFTITNLNNYDYVTLKITKNNDGSSRHYKGRVSDSEETSCVETETVLSSGLTSFEDNDLTGAEDTFCEAYDLGSADSQVVFGCFLSKFLRLPETSESQTILDMFGEDHIDVEADILTGILSGFTGVDNGDRIDVGFDVFNYVDSGRGYEVLPFYDILTATPGPAEEDRQIYADIIQKLVDTSTTADALQEQIISLRDDYEFFEELLETVLADTSFSFDIPQELFYTSADTVVYTKEAQLFMAMVKFTIVGLNIFEAYDYGVDLDKVLSSTYAYGADFDVKVLVADLNGAGETVNGITVDNTAFLKARDLSLITNSKTRFDDGIAYAIAGLLGLKTDASDLLDESFEMEKEEYVADTLTLFREFETSSAAAGMVEITSGGVNLDLYTFFNSPPSAASVTSSDPFVYTDYGTTDSTGSGIKLELVESYFRDLLDGIAEF